MNRRSYPDPAEFDDPGPQPPDDEGYDVPAVPLDMPDRQSIDYEKRQIRTRKAARDELATENAPPVPKSFSGAEFLAQEAAGTIYRLDGLLPAGGNGLLAAQYKAGKTTMRDNFIRTWCDHVPFLGTFAITPAAGSLYVIDAELNADMARRWLTEQGVSHPERFEYHNLRGAASSFNILVPQVRRDWVTRLQDAGAAGFMLDCLGPVLAALGLDEKEGGDVGRFLGAYDEMLAEAGITESLLVHHMGHQDERSRGASRLRDWPDAEWQLVRQSDSPASPRYLKAFGRDVAVTETRLQYDPLTRHLTVAGGTRAQHKTATAKLALLEHLKTHPDRNVREIQEDLTPDHTQKAVREAIKEAVQQGLVKVSAGPNRASLHALTTAGIGVLANA